VHCWPELTKCADEGKKLTRWPSLMSRDETRGHRSRNGKNREGGFKNWCAEVEGGIKRSTKKRGKEERIRDDTHFTKRGGEKTS